MCVGRPHACRKTPTVELPQNLTDNSSSQFQVVMVRAFLKAIVNSEFNMEISTSSLLQVLDGVAVAAKVDSDFVRPLAEQLSAHDRSGFEPAAPDSHDPRKDPNNHSDALSVEAWRTLIASINNAELQRLGNLTLGVATLREKSRLGIHVTSTDLDVIWHLIYDAISKPQDGKIHFTASCSAQGFLAVPLCSLLKDGRIEELFRFHVWLPDGERGAQEVAIHAHQPYAQSWILAGYGTDCTYEVETTQDLSSATHAVYVPRWSDGKQTGLTYKTHHTSSTVTNTGKLVRVTSIGNKTHSRDMTYSIASGVYHYSMVPSRRLHATLFYFDSSRGFLQDAGVIGPKDGRDYTQSRDPAGLTPVALAEMANAVRSWENLHDVKAEGNDEHMTVMAYYRYFHGCALLQAGQREEALKLFNPPHGSGPLHAFCKEPSDEHRRYIETLVKANAALDTIDDQGYKPLGYVIFNEDAAAEALLVEGLHKQLGEDVNSIITRCRYEATVRKEYRDLFEGKIRPILRSGGQDTLEQVRYIYANALATDENKSRLFDGLRYVRYSDVCNAVRLPRYSAGNVKTFSPNTRDDNAKYIIYFCYRWIHKDSITGKTAPDDKVHSQHRRMLRALEDFLQLHPSVNRDKLGLWIVSSGY